MTEYSTDGFAVRLGGAPRTEQLAPEQRAKAAPAEPMKLPLQAVEAIGRMGPLYQQIIGPVVASE